MRAKFALRLLRSFSFGAPEAESNQTRSNLALDVTDLCLLLGLWGKNPKEGKFSRKVVQNLAILSYKATKSPNLFSKIKEKNIFHNKSVGNDDNHSSKG